MQDFTQAEKDLWEAADQLRANSNLASSEYFMPLLGVIFLRHASNRFDAVTAEIAEAQAAGRVPKRKAIKADYVRRRALWLVHCYRGRITMNFRWSSFCSHRCRRCIFRRIAENFRWLALVYVLLLPINLCHW